MESKAMPERAEEIVAFLDTLFGNQEGYVYCPTKNVDTEYWQPYFFKWPSQKTPILTHLMDQSKDKDCYVAPSLFKAPSDKKQAWKGSNHVWIEFDGNAPRKLPEGIPEPTIKIQSSVKGHEHWYWRLSDFITDYKVVEGLCRQLAYTLDADKSGWDASQVLRPPGTLHQESKRRVKVLTSRDDKLKIEKFVKLVEAPEPAVIETTFDDLPSVDSVVAKYTWPEDAYDLFKKQQQPIGSRSSAMTRLGFHCVEMGMTNEECYAVLYNADERWGKYKSRSPSDRAKRLIGIITHCRSKKELDRELNLNSLSEDAFVALGDFRATDLKVRWVFRDFLPEQGLGTISAMPGVGKTTLSIRLGCSVVLRSDFLKWKCELKEQQKVGFLSLEMAAMECKKFIMDMWPSFTPEEQETLDHNFFLLPLGYSMALDSKQYQQFVLDQIDRHGLTFLIIDSLKAATTLDEKKLEKFYNWINKEVRLNRKVTVWIIHHNRKPANEGPRKPKGLEDLYGDVFIAAHPTTVISLWRTAKGHFEVIPLKIRLAEETDPFRIRRTEHLNFEVEGNGRVDPDEGSESVSKSKF